LTDLDKTNLQIKQLEGRVGDTKLLEELVKNIRNSAREVKQHRLAYRAISEVSQGKHDGITKLLTYIDVSRHAYNKSFHRQETAWETQEKLLEERITYWFKRHHQAIGTGKIQFKSRRTDYFRRYY